MLILPSLLQAQPKDSSFETRLAREHRYAEADPDGKGQWQREAATPGIPGSAGTGVGARGTIPPDGQGEWESSSSDCMTHCLENRQDGSC
jgi:hypothetical protein